MVCAQHVDGQVVAPVKLISHVGDIAGDVGGVAIGLDDHAVLIIAVLGGLQPPCALSFVELAVVLELLDGLLHGTGLEEGVLVEVDIEVHAELVEGLLNLGEHHLHARGAEGFLDLGIAAVEGGRVLLQHTLSDLLDVIAAVTVLRGRLALSCGHQRTRKAVDLSAVIVEVVLAGHLRAGGFEHAAQRIAHGGPAGTAQVDRASRVRGDELQVNLLVLVGGVAAKVCAGVENLGHDGALRCGSEANVKESRARDGGLIDGVVAGEGIRQPLRQLAGLGTSLLGYLECQVGGIVTVLRVARALHGDSLWQDGGVQFMLGEHGSGSVLDQDGKIFRIHRAKVYRLRRWEALSGLRG